MAMYYYARRLQKSSSSAKKNKTIQHRDPEIVLNSNGPIITPSVVVGAISTPLKTKSPEVAEITRPVGPSSSTSPLSSQSAALPAGGHSTLSVTRPHPPVGCSSKTNLSKVANTVNNSEQKNRTRNYLFLGKVVNHHILSGTLVFEEGHLISGTLEGFVDYLVPTEEHYPDTTFIFAFILGSRIFIRPHQLLATVLHRAFLNKNENESVSVAGNLVKLLGEWIHHFPYDFRDENGLMMANVRTITHKCVHICPSTKNEVSVLLSFLLEKLMDLEKFENNLAKIISEVHAGISSDGELMLDDAGTRRLINLCPQPQILAEQLTLTELERFSFIGTQEFIQAFIREPCSPPPSTITMTSTTTSTDTTMTPSPVVNCNETNSSSGNQNGPARKLKKSRLELYVEWFHQLSLSVASDVCKTGRKKERVRCLEYWVQVGTNCVTLGNFNSAFAIYTGLNSHPVRRLVKTWSKFIEQGNKFGILEQLCNPTNNFASYRALLKGGESGSTIVPFFSLLIKDLFFLKEAVASSLPNGHLNFPNFLQLGTTVGEVIRWQQGKPALNKIPHLFHVIQTLPSVNEDALMLASFQCEPPLTPEEDGEYHSLLLKLQQLNKPPRPPEDEELTDSFQSLQLLPTSTTSSSGSTSGVHEGEEEEDESGSGISPTTDIHKLLRFNKLGDDETGNSTLPRFLFNSDIQVHVNLPLASESSHGKKIKPPVPL